MKRDRLPDEQLAAAGKVCSCAWNAKRNAGIRAAQARKERRKKGGYSVGRDHDPHEITSVFETNRGRH
jgi:hypothetical protein